MRERDHRRQVREYDAAGPDRRHEGVPGTAPDQVRHRDRHQHVVRGAGVDDKREEAHVAQVPLKCNGVYTFW